MVGIHWHENHLEGHEHADLEWRNNDYQGSRGEGVHLQKVGQH